MTLSDKILKGKSREEVEGLLLLNVKDVKEAINELKEIYCYCEGIITCGFCNKLKKIMGDKLI